VLPASAAPSTDGDSVNELSTTSVVGVEPLPHAFGNARRYLVVGGAGILAVLVGFALWTLAGSSEGDAAPPAPLGAAAANPRITIEPIPVAPHPAGREAEIDAPPGEPVAAPPKETPSALAQPSRQVPRDVPRRSPHKDTKIAPPAPTPFTQAQLTQKYQQVRREYVGYKSKFGARLEREWSDLATFIQFTDSDDAGRREAARRLDAFRGRMRE
jgi:hypothetical protein